MLKKLRQILLVGLLVAIPVFSLAPAVSAQKSEVCEGVGAAGGDCTGRGTEVNTIIENAINLLGYVVGIVAVVMIIIAGFKYITASGDSNNIASAKNTLIWAIVGLVIAASARILVAFVLDKTP